MEGRIEIGDLRVLGVHGALPEERERAQPFACDVRAWLDVGPAAASDALDDTVDYGALARLVATTVAETSYSLLEALAAAVGEQVLSEHPRVTRVEVTVRKVRPPVPLDVGSMGVSVVRDRLPG